MTAISPESHKTRSFYLGLPEVEGARDGRKCASCGQPCQRKYCSTACYRLVQRSGSAEDRFWAKVIKGDGDDCWLWTGNRAGGGKRRSYGQFTVTVAPGKQKHLGAHVYAYELANGPVPAGLHVMHLCNRPLCVRASHLAVGTSEQNNEMAARDGLFHTPRPRRQKMSDDQVEQAISMVRSGMTQEAVGKAFGVTKVTISRIMRGTLRQYRRPSAQRGAA
jgi:hypothetical protein